MSSWINSLWDSNYYANSDVNSIIYKRGLIFIKEIHLFTIGITQMREHKYEVSLYVNGDINTSEIVESRTDIKQNVIDIINKLDFELIE